MRHPGKSCGIRAPILGLLAMIGIILLSETIGLAQRSNQKERGIEGFRKLRWGTSVEEATRIYPDLYFEKYVMIDNKKEPWKVYVRKAEHGEIENVPFDSIEYWFKGGRFYQVRAVLQSRFGPRTLVTQAENDYNKVRQRLKNRYGNPSDQKVEYVTEFLVAVKEATWVVDRSAITIRYEGIGKADEDELTLTMKERGN
ncbi:MAG: hypothetical protein WC899_07420 [bacterium]|jgi:hypothetical protein